MTVEMVLAELEALHAPARDSYGWTFPRCNGCDMDGFEAEAPAWPCRTAAILWRDPAEQDALLADWHEWADMQAAAAHAKYSGSPFIPPIWEAQIAQSLAATLRYLRPGTAE